MNMIQIVWGEGPATQDVYAAALQAAIDRDRIKRRMPRFRGPLKIGSAAPAYFVVRDAMTDEWSNVTAIAERAEVREHCARRHLTTLMAEGAVERLRTTRPGNQGGTIIRYRLAERDYG